MRASSQRELIFPLAWLVAGVKLVSNLEKVMILDNLDVCKPLILLGLQKNIKKISTQHLLVAIGFCLVLSSAAEPYFQGFCGIDVFIWERLNSSICSGMV